MLWYIEIDFSIIRHFHMKVIKTFVFVFSPKKGLVGSLYSLLLPLQLMVVDYFCAKLTSWKAATHPFSQNVLFSLKWSVGRIPLFVYGVLEKLCWCHVLPSFALFVFLKSILFLGETCKNVQKSNIPRTSKENWGGCQD